MASVTISVSADKVSRVVAFLNSKVATQDVGESDADFAARAIAYMIKQGVLEYEVENRRFSDLLALNGELDADIVPA